MKLTNNKIYSCMQELNTFNLQEVKMPVRISFFLQKNIQTIALAAQEIEQARMNIAKEYGELNENGTSYTILPEKMEIVNQELSDLFNLEQDLNIHIFKLDDFDGIELEFQQLSAIMFMIEE